MVFHKKFIKKNRSKMYKKEPTLKIFGVPRGTRTPIGRLGGDCSILLSYGHISFYILTYIFLIDNICYNIIGDKNAKNIKSYEKSN